MIKPTGISHIAMVTADLDRYRDFYEGTIGLDTALVLGPGPDHGRHAIFFAGDSVLHVFEVDGYDPAAHGIGTTMFERGRLDHLGFTVADQAALAEVRDRLVAVERLERGHPPRSDRCCRSATRIPTGSRARSTASTPTSTGRHPVTTTRSPTPVGTSGRSGALQTGRVGADAR